MERGRKVLCALPLALCAMLLLYASPARADTTIPSPGNNGQTGLWDMPNARIMPDWTGRINIISADPYRYWSGTVGLLDRLEFNGRFTDITTVPFAGQEYSRDKAIDLKFLLVDERDWVPAMALGLTDIHGTGVFASRYLAFSKRFDFIDVTLGLGQGIIGGEVVTSGKASDFHLTSPSEVHTRLFGGLEVLITDDLSFVAEYSSFDYEDLKGGSKAKSPVNAGFKYLYKDFFLTSLSYQKGEKLSFGLGFTTPFDPELFLPWRKDRFYAPPEKVRLDAFQAENQGLAEIVADQVSLVGFENVRATAKQDAVWVEFDNNRYFSNQKAVGRVVRILDRTVPPRIDWFYLALTEDDVRIYTWKVHRSLFNGFKDYRLDETTLWKNSEHDMSGERLWHEFTAHTDDMPLKQAPRGRKNLNIRLAPRIKNLVNDPSGFLKSSISLVGSLDYRPWKGGLFQGSIQAFIYNNISTSNVLKEPCPPRTDFVDYLGDSGARVETLAFDQIVQLPGNVWARGAVGYFESAYMGGGGEVFRFFDQGKFGAGLEFEYVKKRDLDSQFKPKEDCSGFHAAFLNLYSHVWPSQGIDAGLKIGRFLGGDKGVRVDLSRTYKYFTLGVWVTFTDTSDFVADINRGYEDKGIYLTFPLSIFFNSDIAGRFSYVLRPWTRDPGATVAQPRSLYPFIDQGNAVIMKEHSMEMLQ